MSEQGAVIAVVGCGTIGSRHAQALGRLNRPAVVHLVDPSAAARKQAAALCRQEMAGSSKVSLVEHDFIDGLPDAIDVAIVATVAAVRRTVLERLIAEARVRYAILEKFLFQAENDYDVVERALAAADVKAFVNCPRRLWPGYQELKQLHQGRHERIALSCVTHARFGIATSAIHLLDALVYLSGRDGFGLHHDRLDPDLISNARGGIEMTGTLYGGNADGDFFRYSVYGQGSHPPLVNIEALSWRAIIDEASQEMRLSLADSDWTWEKRKFATFLQSQLTDHIVTELLETQSCGLPDFAQSSRLHLSILSPLLAHYRTHSDRAAMACPIT